MDTTTAAATTENDDWLPHSCTLPTAEQPLRVREFDDLFANSLRSVEQPSPAMLRLTIDASAQESAADLTQREIGCCSFFTFTFGEPDRGHVALVVSVPDSNVDVLEALASRAASITGLTA